MEMSAEECVQQQEHIGEHQITLANPALPLVLIAWGLELMIALHAYQEDI